MLLETTPFITYLIIGITVLISYQAFGNENLKERLLHSPFLVSTNREYFRLLSHGFVHANITHLFFNMFVLWMFGMACEKFLVYYYGAIFGRILFIVLYFGSILFATIPSMRKHKDNPYYRSLGASGAVSAVVIVYMIINPLAEIYFFMVIPMKAYLAVILFFAFEAYMNRRGNSFIAHDAHIWGAIFGALFLLILDYGYIINFFYTIGNRIGLI